jgi:hypothetical protein
LPPRKNHEVSRPAAIAPTRTFLSIRIESGKISGDNNIKTHEFACQN